MYCTVILRCQAAQRMSFGLNFNALDAFKMMLSLIFYC